MKSYISESLSLGTNITPMNLPSKPAKPASSESVISLLSLVSLLPAVSLSPLHVAGFLLCASSELASLYVVYSCFIY